MYSVLEWNKQQQDYIEQEIYNLMVSSYFYSWKAFSVTELKASLFENPYEVIWSLSFISSHTCLNVFKLNFLVHYFENCMELYEIW